MKRARPKKRDLPKEPVPGCKTCAEKTDWKPSHNGMPHCQSGSLASGGKNAHCTCDSCF